MAVVYYWPGCSNTRSLLTIKMPPRSKVSQLPTDVKAELDKKLIGSAFSGYRAIETWLNEQGFQISHSAIHTYGQEFQKNLDNIKTSTEQAKAIVAMVGDDENALGEAVTSLALQKALEALLALDVTITKTDDGSPDKFAYEWTKLLRAVGQLSNQSIANKQYRSKVQKIIEEEIKAMELEARAKATGTVAEQAEAEVMNLALEKVRQIHGLI
jgi:Protein of unknown function (DUF3486)